ncbi:MAG: DUF2834 domain-containing protein, partial [Pseudomonadota bacterium]
MSRTQRKAVYLVLGIAGGVLPWVFAGRVFASGQGLWDFLGLAVANPAATAVALDISFSTAVAGFFAWREARRLEIRGVWICAPLLVVALATALAVFLWMRENRLEELERDAP